MIKLWNFSSILEQAKAYYNQLSETKKMRIKNDLNHGRALLDDNDELKGYIALYGEIHRDKLLRAFSHIQDEVYQKDISVIDWGCGQGLATLLLQEYMENLGGYNIKEVVLIEPSAHCLAMAVNYIQWAVPEVSILAIPQKEEMLTQSDLPNLQGAIIHLLSNVIDMPEFSGEKILGYVSSHAQQPQIVVCVSPYYSEDGRGKRMDEFGKKLEGFSRTYCFQRHIDDWKEDYSCQIHIYSNRM